MGSVAVARVLVRRATSAPVLALLAAVLATAAAADAGITGALLGAWAAVAAVSIALATVTLAHRRAGVPAPWSVTGQPSRDDASTQPLGRPAPATGGEPQPRAPGAAVLLPRTA